MNDKLGDRMKAYENVNRFKISRRTYTIIRVDGKAFKTYTKGLDKPFDAGLIEDMNLTTVYLCENIQNAKLGYVQSDEISILISDFDEITTDAWFDNNLQKMGSVAASLATSKFNQLRTIRLAKQVSDIPKIKLAQFDARVFQISQKSEVLNYFLWRQQDATRNSIASVAQSLYQKAERKQLEGKNSNEQQELIFQKGINWNNYPARMKRGGLIERVKFVNGKDMSEIPFQEIGSGDVVRNKWVEVECPNFSQDRNYLDIRIKNND